MSGRRQGRQPVLVTGVPRSGTTWLARWLSLGDRMAFPGREPMNPRHYGLGRTLSGWARLTAPSPRQVRTLKLSYQGLNPWVYSRYGIHQWLAPLPFTRLVVKDPFALLSIPAIVEHTGAVVVLVYRHPGAVLASYRRMGWTPDLVGLQEVVTSARRNGGPELPDLPAGDAVAPAEAMGRFWATLHDLALHDIDTRGTDVLIVAHHELASSGPAGGRQLADRLGIAWNSRQEQELVRAAAGSDSPSPASSTLHNFDRAPSAVAEAWRTQLSPSEVDAIEATAASTLQDVSERRFRLG